MVTMLLREPRAMAPQDVYDMVQEALRTRAPGGVFIENVMVDGLDDHFRMCRRPSGAQYVTATTRAAEATWYLPKWGPTTLVSYR